MNTDACRDFIAEAGETCKVVTEWDSTSIFGIVFVAIAMMFMVYELTRRNNG